jgi:hypothetical protein
MIENNNLGAEGAKLIAKSLKENKGIRELNLGIEKVLKFL